MSISEGNSRSNSKLVTDSRHKENDVISKEKILNLSSQLYMGLSEEEIQKLYEDVGKIVENTQILNEVDVSNIKPDVAVLDGYYNAFREDEVIDYKEKELLFKNAKEVEQDMFKIPKIV